MMILQKTLNLASSDLGPLYEPEAVSFSFQSPGWYILAVLLILLAAYFLVKWIRSYLRNAYRREALKNLSTISSLSDTLALLKIVAIQTFGRESVAPLYGDEWLDFLEEKGRDTPFRKYSSSISRALYEHGKLEGEQLEKIIGLSKIWIKTHA
jgi:hypothetical protein